MKVILLQDIANIGQKFEVKEVSDGFALNFLIPQGKARFADKGTVEKMKDQEEKMAEQKERRDSELKKSLLDRSVFEITAKANEEGHLFAKIDINKVADLISETLSKEVHATQVDMEAPIKEIGEHEVGVLVGEEEVKVTIKVVAE